MKQLVFGVVIGALAVAAGESLLKSKAPVVDPAAAVAKTAVVVSASATPCKPDVAQLAPPAIAAVQPTPVATAPATSGAPSTAAEPEDCPCYQGYLFRKAERETAARRAEPKDDWSYTTEQGLQQLIAGLPQANQFEISNIDCRKTFCEIRATTATYTGESTFMQVIKATLQQDSLGLNADAFQGEEHATNGKREMVLRVKRRSP